MIFFYIIRFQNEPAFKIGITKNLDSRIKRHYHVYNKQKIDLENVSVTKGDSRKIKVLENYIKAMFENYHIEIVGHTEIFGKEDESRILETVARICADMDLEQLESYEPDISKKNLQEVSHDYEQETREQLANFYHLLSSIEIHTTEIKTESNGSVSVFCDPKNMSLELVQSLVDFRFIYTYTFDTGFGMCNFVTNCNVHIPLDAYESVKQERDEFFESPVLSDQEYKDSLKYATKISLTFKVSDMEEAYPDLYSDLKMNLEKFEKQVSSN